jgi:hypothetical protein
MRLHKKKRSRKQRLVALLDYGLPIAKNERRKPGTKKVRTALEALPCQASDEEVEDRVLDVLDLVTGFCSREDSVWDV